MVSPARQQYLDLKRKHEDAILLYRLGDFYEMFDRDAEIASKVLGLQLTARNYPRGEGRVPMAGVPHHAVFGYIKRLLEAGHRVALCEQMSEAGKGLVDRDIVRVFTPGTLIEPEMLETGRNTYLAAVSTSKTALGLAFVDVSTGEFNATEFDGADMIPRLEAELLRISPAECLFPLDGKIEVELPATTSLGPARPNIDGRSAENRLRQHLNVGSLAGFGLDGKPAAVAAAVMALEYLNETNRAVLTLIDAVKTYSTDTFMLLDRYTRSSLELLPAAGDGARRWTLLRVLDHTKTSMGARLLRVLIGRPLLDIGQIDSRLDMVAALVGAPMAVRSLGSTLGGIGDLERIAGRVAHGKSGASDLVQLRQSLLESTAISDEFGRELPELAGVLARIDGCPEICEAIGAAIGVGADTDIKTGYSSELDGLRATAEGAREAIAALEKDEIKASGIKSLRIGYNKVFGYYIEVGKAAAGTVPAHYVRQQTLLNSERYFTPEIKELESKILTARDDAARLEKQLLDELIELVGESHERIMMTAGAIAELDAYRSLAEAALSNGYVRPALNDGLALDIRDGRHPVVEAAVSDTAFVPNDCAFDENQRIIVLMGPNMGGKSTMLRTVALIVLMAQIGSFVPAAGATIGIVDRLFSRVGAQDDISAGQSTFMTEMVETANILHHATPRSLLILDEIGRGTSTYDGLAIARAVIEYIHARTGARTLFATHYHELAALEDELSQVRTYHTAVADHEGKVIFLHRIVPGGADRSYGIHVARLAGLPHSVTVRAERILGQLERSANGSRYRPGPQLALFSDPDLAPKSDAEAVAIRVLDELLALDLAETTPREALDKLHQYQDEGRSGR